MTRTSIAAATAIVLAAMAVLLFPAFGSDPWRDLAAGAPREQAVRLAALDGAKPAVFRSAVRALRPAEDVDDLARVVLSSDCTEHQRAVAELLAGETEAAERRLVALTRSTPSAAIWNDLAVVLLAKSATVRDETPFAALAAAEHAIDLDPSLHTARFNRALVIERMGLRDLAIGAYDEYCRIDSAGDRCVEAQGRSRALRAASTGDGAWRDRVSALQRAADDGDRSTVLAAVASSPQEARTFALSDLLPAWGESTMGRRMETAQSTLAFARLIGSSLLTVNRDAMVADAVRAIDGAAGREATLASAHALYGRAAARYRERRIAEAAALFSEARDAFEQGGSPAILWADYYRASAAADIGDWRSALAGIDAVGRASGPRYPTLLAQTKRLHGTVMAFGGMFGPALQSYREAREGFVALGETNNAVDVAARMAAVLAELGRPGEAWLIHREAVAAAGSDGSPRLVQNALHAAMFVALEESRWGLAHALLRLEIDVADANPRTHAEALVWRGLTAKRAGMSRTATAGLVAARSAVRDIPDATFRRSAENDLRLVEALLVEEQSPATAYALLTEYIEVSTEQHRLSRLPAILVARSRALRRMDRKDDAEQDLREAIRIIEARQERVPDELLRDTFLGKAAAAYLHLASLRDEAGDIAGAVDVMDRPRARVLRGRARAGALLPESNAVVSFGLYDERTAIYVTTNRGVERFEGRETISALRPVIDAFVSAARRDDLPAFRTAGRRLYDALIAPASTALQRVEKIAFVPDAPLDAIPFGGLTGPRGRFLVEDHLVVISPAVRAYRDPAAPDPSPATLVAIGNPRLDPRRHASLLSLPGAAQEARGVAAMYPRGEVLIDVDATRSRTVDAMQRATVLHFGTHAIADAATPNRSRLVLAGAEELAAEDIARMSLPRLDTVVLAGCQTAASSRAYGFLQSLAAAFQVAGARSVIGSLWDVDDTPVRDLSLGIHRALSRGVSADRALREAQLRAITGPPSAWAALQVYEVR